MSRHADETIWTDLLIARFRDLHEQGTTFSEIAEILSGEFHVKLTKNSMIGKGRRLGLVKRRTASHWPRKPYKPRAPKVPPPPRKAPKVPPPAPEPEAPPASRRLRIGWAVELPAAPPGRIAIWQLERGRCHFPFGDWPPPYAYCGAPSGEHTYCPACQIRMYGPRRAA